MGEKYVYKINAVIESVRKRYVIKDYILKVPVYEKYISYYVIGGLYEFIQTKSTKELFVKIVSLDIEYLDIEF